MEELAEARLLGKQRAKPTLGQARTHKRGGGTQTRRRGRREQAVPPALVWLWRLEEEETEETRQTLNVNPTVKVGTIVC